jgi:iron complex transport system substrate-binding protein
VGWGIGEDELRVQSSGSGQALGIFSMRTSPWHRRWWAGLLIAAGVFIVATAAFANTGDEKSSMTRRQQGILTGMPFMAHVSARAYVDDAGRRMYFAKPPSRIVSLAPSITEMLFAMEAGEQLVGVTDFCDYPPEVLQKPKVGYSNPNLETLVALHPDLVVAPSDFLKPDVVVKLEQLKIPVFILADQSIERIFAHIQTLGRIVGRSPKADAVAMQLRQQVAAIQQRIQGIAPVRMLYVLNSQPLITVGPGSFIDQLIGMAGGINVAAKSATPYPRLSMESVLQEDPEVLVFPVGKAEGISESEQQAWRQWSTMTAVKQGRLHQISADWLNRPGPRIGKGLESLAEILHPDSVSGGRAERQPE